MKSFTTDFYLIILAALLIVAPAYAYQSIDLGNSNAGVSLLDQDQQGLTIKVDIGKIDIDDVKTKAGQYALLTVDGFARPQNIGEPNLPIMNRLISIPYGCELGARVVESDYQEISLTELGVSNPIMPVQPSLAKNQNPDDVPFEYNQALYQQVGYYAMPLADTKIIGVMRAMRLGLVSVAPIQYNPTENTLRVYSHLTVQVNFNHPDWVTTRETFNRLHSPYFAPVYDAAINYSGQQSLLLDDITQYPVKYLIVSNRMFEAQLQPFVQWKIKRGFKVIVGYTDSIGTTNTAIKNYIRTIYDQGTPEDPAPSFVLFVGDAQQIPPFPHGGHISDLDFCEYTGDNIPEIYYGRFSAQTTNLLQPQIDKTLEYEQYLMPDPSYLGNVTMIAGVDANYAPTYGNGQINYGTENYFNSAHGIYSNTYLYPASNGPVESEIISQINGGLSYINYTAHGSHESWADPTITVSNLNALTNVHKYCLAVGNCCLTNTFGTDYGNPCLGEAWLQNANKGAIGYLGASNNSYWDEDYWWGVGFKSVVVHPPYNASHLGAYDGMFHDHGEPVAEHYVTNDAINFRGNLAVTESGSSMIAYYWQIYHLMGDPSVMTYLGVPETNDILHDPTILLTATSFTVQADPGSYVGISMNGVLHGAGYVDSSGSVEVALIPFDAPGTADIVVTCQNRVPYIATIQVITPSGPYVIYDGNLINDSNGNNNGQMDCGENILLGVQLKNVGPNTANGVSAVLSVQDSFITITDSTESFGSIPGNNGWVNRANAYAFHVSGNTPDDHTVRFTLTVTGTPLDTWVSNFNIDVHAPILNLLSVRINDSSGNNNGILDPGETAEMIVKLRNGGSVISDSTSGVISENDPYVSINDANGYFGSIAIGDSADNSGNVFVVAASSSCPMGHAMSFDMAIGGARGFSTNVTVPVMVGDRVTVYSDDFSSNIGWTGLGGAGEWTIGLCTGGSGSDGYGGPDPSTDNSPSTDNRVLGNDLTSGSGGDYAGNLAQTYYVTSPVIDCSEYSGIIMTYYHWLGVEGNTYDHAYLEAWNGTAWIALFSNGSSTIDESSWSMEQYDLSAIADTNSTFKIRFGIGRTDGSWNYCGWNIDDILIKGYHQSTSGNPNLSFSIVSISDSLVQGDSVSVPFVIRNTGDGVLRLHFSSLNEWLHFNSAQIEIPPFDSTIFTLTINSASLDPGTHTGALTYSSNDVDNPSGTIPVNIFIYAPNIQVPQTAVGDTILSGQQSSVPLIINNTGTGRLFYSIEANESGLPIVMAKKSAVDKPLGYRLEDTGKSDAQEPYYPPVIAGSGGPDAFGYEWIDSDETGGPAYNWVDITGSGTEIPLNDDDQTLGPFDIGFDFSFYGNTFSQFYACTNGWLSLTDGTNDFYNNQSLPNTSGTPFNLLAPFWDDQDFSSSGDAYYYSNNSDSLVISWVNVPHYSSGGPYTYQIILLSNGKIFFQYQSMGSPVNSATIGIQNSDGTIGLQVVYNADYLHDEMAIKFSSGGDWLSIDQGSGSINPMASDTVMVQFDAADLVDSLYHGQINISSNDPDSPSILIPVTLLVGEYAPPGCVYIPGDMNGNGSPNGIDVVYGVNYFKGGPVPPVDCHSACLNMPDPFYAAGDINGNCSFNGIDITYLVRYLKGQVSELLYCPDCPPAQIAAPISPVMPALKAKSMSQDRSTD